ncbi:MAG: hypothetical protein ACREOZ_05200 [Gloeomargaritales cyanobacterium]
MNVRANVHSSVTTLNLDSSPSIQGDEEIKEETDESEVENITQNAPGSTVADLSTPLFDDATPATYKRSATTDRPLSVRSSLSTASVRTRSRTPNFDRFDEQIQQILTVQ